MTVRTRAIEFELTGTKTWHRIDISAVLLPAGENRWEDLLLLEARFMKSKLPKSLDGEPTGRWRVLDATGTTHVDVEPSEQAPARLRNFIQEAYTYGDGWFISKRNELEGVVERHSLLSMQSASGYRLLAFWRRPAYDAHRDAYEGL